MLHLSRVCQHRRQHDRTLKQMQAWPFTGLLDKIGTTLPVERLAVQSVSQDLLPWESIRDE